MPLSTIRKALAGALAAAVAAAVTAYPDGFTNQEYATIVGAAIVAGLAVFQIRNEPSPPRKRAIGDSGAGELTLIVIAAAVCIVVLAVAKALGWI